MIVSMIRRLVIAGFGLLIVLVPRTVVASSAELLHRAAWDSSLAWSGQIRAIPFSYYAYRTWAVPHPEVYLQADRLFSEVVENLPGSRIAYRTRDVRNLDLYQRMARRELKGASFAWSYWAIAPDSVLDPPPGRAGGGEPWLDRRLPSAAVLLRAVSAHLTTAEAAVMNYTRLRRLGRGSDSLFVIIDGAGRGYLTDDSILRIGGVGEPMAGEWSAIAPAVVFNEHSAFYPLFGRDDRPLDPALAHLLRRLGPPAALDFSAQDLSRLSQLRRVAALPDTLSARLAVLVSAGLVDITNPQVRAAWVEYLGTDDSASLACAVGMVEEATFWADRLSPRTAELASLASADSLPAALADMQDQYLSWCGRRVNPTDSGDMRREAWGVLWSYGLHETVFDDMIRTRAGSGVSQGTATSAALDLAGRPHFGLLVQGGKNDVPDQDWVLAGGGRFQFNLGVWTRLPDVATTVRRVAVIAVGYTTPGHWVRFIGKACCADIDPLTVAGDIARINEMMPLAALTFQLGPDATMPYRDLAAGLTAGELARRNLPWPSR